MSKAITWIVIIALALGAGWYFWMRYDAAQLEQLQVPPALVQEPAEPQVQHPVSEIALPPEPQETTEPAPPPEPLPALADSDAPLTAAANALLGSDAVAQLLVNEQVVNRLVATIDSIPSSKLVSLMVPWQPLPGSFQVLHSQEQAVISPANAERYAALADLAGSVDSQRLVELYVKYYPLFQQSYQALGYPDGYFNDRLVQVIDHLLATPEPADMMPLVPVEAVYAYADPDLEALSAGQKMLLRAGPEQSALAKAKLREIRALVAAQDLQADN
jgi:hypothetical protein